jgi:opacity protein-like surface antigen
MRISKNQITACLLFCFLILVSANKSYSQEYSKLDSIKIGQTYKVVLFDDTEIIGKAEKQDSLTITLRRGSISLVIQKENIFTLSKDINPSKYRLIISLQGGITMLSGSFLNGFDGKTSLGYSGHVGVTFPISESKAVRIGFGYSRISTKDNHDYYYQNEMSEGGDLFYTSLSGDLLLGNLKPSDNFKIYAILGLGIHLTHQSLMTTTYYNTYDSTYHTFSQTFDNHLNIVLGLGGGFGFKLSEHFTAFSELQYQMISTPGFIFFGNGYFTIRAGLALNLY